MRYVALREVAVDRGLVGGPFGSSLVNADYADEGIPVIRGANMSVGRYVGGDFVYVSEEKFARDLARNSASPGDVVYTQRGTLGQVGLVPPGTELYVVSQSQMRLRVNTEVADARFIYYASTAPEFIKQVHDRAISTGVPHTNLAILSDLEVPLPPLPEQQAIAEVLGVLDDKIAANTKLAAAADELARLTFLNALNDPVDVPLSSAARFINGKALTKNASGTGRVVIRIAELNSGIGGSTVFSDVDVDDQHVARSGDILFAWSGSLTLHRWFRDEAIVNQHIFKVIPNDGYPAWLVYRLIESKLAGFKDIAANKATTMGHIQRHHLDVPVLVPARSVIKQLDVLMSALWDCSLTAERENLTLAATRDALLPHLMSGKLRVRDAEAALSAVGV